MVTFVGAGPGAADLLTLRGLERLRDAGCEVHVCDSVEAGCHALSL